MARVKTGMKLGGKFDIECYRGSKLIWEEHCENLICNEGLDAWLDIMLHASTQITTWMCVLSDSDATATAAMTYAVPVFNETTAYDETVRPIYVEAAASSQSTTNSSNKATFTVDATLTVYGAGILGGGSDATTKDDQAGGGTLLCYAAFGASRAAIDNDTINLTYTIGAADDGS